ncbi:MAG: VWA domain-containing protein [Actinomycetota bacterium]|nr:VWA domain-containing protein [Actinomycetota bacterium]
MQIPVFPFPAVVGQEDVKLALLVNAISQEVNGVLIRGPRGTAKSTLARGIAELLPDQEVVEGCPFSCDPSDAELLCSYCKEKLESEGYLSSTRRRIPIIDLPLNATEEMVVGTLDIQKALKEGEKSFQPGILARANRSILYIDEVNLLEDYIVDILLDSSASGVNIVEREGVSFSHRAKFILVGTMNPEEGDLRPQLEDRFGLCAEVELDPPLSARAEILKRNEGFRMNPYEFIAKWEEAKEELRARVSEAKLLCPNVAVSDHVYGQTAAIVSDSGAEGHRADMAILGAARAIAALEGATEVEEAHLLRAAPLALNHRKGKIQHLFQGKETLEGDSRPKPYLAAVGNGHGSSPTEERGKCEVDNEIQGVSVKFGDAEEEVQKNLEKLKLPRGKPNARLNGRRETISEVGTRGRYYRSAPKRDKEGKQASNIAIDATIRAMAFRASSGKPKPEIEADDLRVKVRRRKVGSSIVFVVDASASMGARARIAASHQAIMALLEDAYKKRDRVGMVIFKDKGAELAMSPTSSRLLAQKILNELTPGGATPLSQGLALGYDVLLRELRREPKPEPYLILISDGEGNVPMSGGDPFREALNVAKEIREKEIKSLVFDSAGNSSGHGGPKILSPARKIAREMGSAYFSVSKISGEVILDRLGECWGEAVSG